MAKKKKNSKIYFSVARFITFAVLSVIIIAGGLFFKSPIEKVLNGQELQTDMKKIDHDGLIVHYIDVGQADCIAIEFPSGEKMLIDSGDKSSVNQMLEYLDKNVFEEANEAKVFDYVLLTHSDSDHCGGMPKIFETYQVNKVYRPQIYINSDDISSDLNCGNKTKMCETVIYTSTINSMINEPNCEMFYVVKDLMNTTYKIENSEFDYSFEFYSPLEDYYTDVNDFSPIFSLTYKEKVFMFTGDASIDCEAEALISNLPKVDVLKVGHHGSKTSSSEEFINAIKPVYSIIQVGEDNSYGHPNKETINTLEYFNSKIYRTDINKNIVANVNIDGELLMYANVVLEQDKISVLYLIIGLEAICIYFCFFVKYKNSKIVN